MPRLVTMREVAAAAGVHVMTVSRALRRDGRISEATRLKVEAAARRLDYRPNPLVSALFRFRRATRVPQYRATLAIVSCEPDEAAWTPAERRRGMFLGARQAAEEQGYLVTYFHLFERPELSLARLAGIMRTRNVQGLAILPLQRATAITLDFPWRDFSVVYLGYPFLTERFSRVTFNIGLGVHDAWQRVRALGHTRIGLVVNRAVEERNHGLREAMWLRLQRERPARERVPACVIDNTAGGEPELRRWLQRHRPDAVLHAYVDGERLRRSQPAARRSVPLFNLTIAEGETGPGMYQDPIAHGRVGIELLIAMVNRNERGEPGLPITTLIEPVWQPAPAGAQVERRKG
jgi:LacI family transcriptional regulator